VALAAWRRPEHVARALVARHAEAQAQALAGLARRRQRRMSATTATAAGKALCYGGYHPSVTLLFADIKGACMLQCAAGWP
jgi:hypothetical protein